MEVYGSSITNVSINPIVVLDKLVEEVIEENSWVFEENGKFYRGFYSGGSHSYEEREEIDRSLYDYVMAIYYIKSNYEVVKNKK